MCGVPLLGAIGRESYNDPGAVYHKLGAHAMRSVGCAYTVVPGAREKLTHDVLAIGRNMVRENPWTLPVPSLGVAVPLAILGNYIVENAFARWWIAQYRRAQARGNWKAEAGGAVPVPEVAS